MDQKLESFHQFYWERGKILPSEYKSKRSGQDLQFSDKRVFLSYKGDELYDDNDNNDYANRQDKKRRFYSSRGDSLRSHAICNNPRKVRPFAIVDMIAIEMGIRKR